MTVRRNAHKFNIACSRSFQSIEFYRKEFGKNGSLVYYRTLPSAFFVRTSRGIAQLCRILYIGDRHKTTPPPPPPFTRLGLIVLHPSIIPSCLRSFTPVPGPVHCPKCIIRAFPNATLCKTENRTLEDKMGKI